MSEEAIERYREVYAKDGADALPPLVVFKDGSGAPIVADGCHRLEAAKRAGLKWLFFIVKKGDRRDAVLFAATGANHEHGLPLTNADKRHAVATLLRDADWVKWSDREIARRCRVSPNLVGDVRGSVAGAQSTKRKGKDGRERETKNIGKTKGKPVTKGDPAVIDTASDICQAIPDLHPNKAAVLAALYTAHDAEDGVLTREQIAERIGYAPDVHPRQLEKSGLLIAAGDGQAWKLSDAGWKYIEDGFGIGKDAKDDAPAEDAAKPRLGADAPSRGKGKGAIRQAGDEEAAERQEPKDDRPAEQRPLAERRAEWIRNALADRLDAGKIGSVPVHEAAALVLVTGLESGPERYSRDLVDRAGHLLAEEVAKEIAFHLREGDALLAQLPAIADLCRIFHQDYDKLAADAASAIAE